MAAASDVTRAASHEGSTGEETEVMLNSLKTELLSLGTYKEKVVVDIFVSSHWYKRVILHGLLCDLKRDVSWSSQNIASKGKFMGLYTAFEKNTCQIDKSLNILRRDSSHERASKFGLR